MDKQVISKQRVADHGEVLTGRREVNAMLDLVKSETERIDSRFLEPACGTGNFLAEIGTSHSTNCWSISPFLTWIPNGRTKNSTSAMA